MIKEVEITYNGEKKTVKIKRFNAGERNQWMTEFTTIKMVGGENVVNVDSKKMMETALVKSIIEAPFEISIPGVQSLDTETFDSLFSAFKEMNEQSGKKNKAD